MSTYRYNARQKPVEKINKDIKHLLIIWSLVIISGLLMIVFINYSIANAISDKADDACTGHETTGRCADKCPAPSFTRGFDKETGAAICGHVTGCPYGDSIPLGPECDRHAPAVNANVNVNLPANYVNLNVNKTPQTVDDVPAEVNGFVGK